MIEDLQLLSESRENGNANNLFTRITVLFDKNKRLAKIVEDLTKPDKAEIGKKEADELYVKNLSIASDEALLVKMADRLHNLWTIDGLPPEKRNEYLVETEQAYLPIFEEGCENYPIQKGIFLSEIFNILHSFLPAFVGAKPYH